MLVAEQCFCEINNAPLRAVRARVELYNGSTLIDTYKHTDALINFTIERVGESSKFYGFGVTHKLNLHLRDINREIKITTANTLDVAFGVGCDFLYAFPLFKVSRVNRDENTNELSITAYDALYQAPKYTVNDLGLPQTYTLKELAAASAAKLGLPLKLAADGFDLIYSGNANFEGIEPLNDVLNAIAEATQTIYFIDASYSLTFKRLDRDGAAVAAITKDTYFTLDSGTNRRLAAVCNATDLGDNVEAKLSVSGTTQYMRDNPLLELRQDIAAIVDTALARVGGTTINQFECNWRGNYLIEIGDKINLTTKDNNVVHSYLLDDVITYDGSFSQKTQWHYNDNEGETASNPSNLGDALKQTFSRVDKVNKQITLLASEVTIHGDKISSIVVDTEGIKNTVTSIKGEVDTNKESIGSLQVNADSLNASVEELTTTTAAGFEDINGKLATITKKVEASITAEDVNIKISEALEDGVNKIVTDTGYVFDETGLTVSKSDSEMTTTISEDGMTIKRNNQEVLIANNKGVVATNLHANTYLIIGKNSRFEDYDYNRTGCFWIGP